MDNKDFLKQLADRLRDDANYFDESHEYDRMNDLDKARVILIELSNIVGEIENEQLDIEKLRESWSEDFQYKDPKYYAIKKDIADNLVSTIEKSKCMKPFQVSDED